MTSLRRGEGWTWAGWLWLAGLVGFSGILAASLSRDRADWDRLGTPFLLGPDLPHYAAVQEWHADPALYRRDVLLSLQVRLYPPFPHRALYWMRERVGDAAAYRTAWVGLNLIWLSGLIVLACAAGAGPAAGTLAAAMTASLFAHRLPGDMVWGIIPPWEVTPAGLGGALLPWLAAAMVRAGDVPRAALAGLAAGVLGLVHPVTTLHAGCVGAVVCLGWGRARLARAAALLGVAGVGLLPFWLRVRGLGAHESPELAILKGFSPEAVGGVAGAVVDSALHLLPVAVLGAVWLARRNGEALRLRALGAGGIVVAAGTVLGWAGVTFLLPGRWLRATMYTAAALYIGAAAWLGSHLRRHPHLIGAAACLLMLALAGNPGGGVYAVAKVAKDVLFGPRMLFVQPVSRSGEKDPCAVKELAVWARDRLPSEAHVLVPPDEFGMFRALSRRGVVVVLTDRAPGWYLPAYAREWHARYSAVTGAYDARDPAALLQMARRYGADHIVVPREWTIPGRRLYANRGYALYRPGPGAEVGHGIARRPPA